MSYMVKVFHGFVDFIKAHLFSGNDKFTTKKYTISFLLVSTLLFTVLVELIQRASILGLFIWIFNSPIEFILNLVIVLAIVLLLNLLSPRIFIGMLLSFVLLVSFSTTSHIKYLFLGEPILPWDFTRVDQVVDLLPKIYHQVLLILVILILVICIFIFLIKKISPKYKFNYIQRLILGIVAISILYGCAFYHTSPFGKFYSYAGIQHITWRESDNTSANGLLLGFALNIEQSIIPRPDNYTQENMNKIIDEYPVADSTNKIKPNVIIIMNEACWDPTLLSNVNFSPDPMPTIRSIRNDYSSGWMISPVFGGGTANVEFEVLTGLSTSFLPCGSIAYQQYINDPVPSLASLLANEGYKSIAVHPYHGWFYKRDKVYPLFGFEDFLDMDSFDAANKAGEYIGDMQVTNKIIDTVKNNDSPVFMYAVTMQNHGPYPINRYQHYDINVDGDISEDSKEILQCYSQGIHDADLSIEKLTQYLSSITEPTIVVYFGDHLPFLGNNYQAYVDAKYIPSADNWGPEEQLKMRSVPMFIWNNYDLPKENIGNISPSFLGSYILDYAGLQKSTVFNFTDKLKELAPVYNNMIVMDSDSEVLNKVETDKNNLIEEYQLIQYDLLFGDKYISPAK
ncbi:MAG: LTA synthase family protein [Eubacteriales bacterium]